MSTHQTSRLFTPYLLDMPDLIISTQIILQPNKLKIRFMNVRPVSKISQIDVSDYMNTIVSRNCANNMNDPTGGYGPRNKLNYFSPFMDIQDPATG
jgi:hypothetical protein